MSTTRFYGHVRTAGRALEKLQALITSDDFRAAQDAVTRLARTHAEKTTEADRLPDIPDVEAVDDDVVDCEVVTEISGYDVHRMTDIIMGRLLDKVLLDPEAPYAENRRGVHESLRVAINATPGLAVENAS